MVRKYSAADLTKQIVGKQVITKQSVLNEMKAKAADPDIEVGSSVMSLKDPISTSRIEIPCRSTVCTHNQCFDAGPFLQLQEQAPTWIEDRNATRYSSSAAALAQDYQGLVGEILTAFAERQARVSAAA